MRTKTSCCCGRAVLGVGAPHRPAVRYLHLLGHHVVVGAPCPPREFGIVQPWDILIYLDIMLLWARRARRWGFIVQPPDIFIYQVFTLWSSRRARRWISASPSRLGSSSTWPSGCGGRALPAVGVLFAQPLGIFIYLAIMLSTSSLSCCLVFEVLCPDGIGIRNAHHRSGPPPDDLVLGGLRAVCNTEASRMSRRPSKLGDAVDRAGRPLVCTLMHGVVSCLQVLKCSTAICRDVHAAVRQIFPSTNGLLLAVGNNIP